MLDIIKSQVHLFDLIPPLKRLHPFHSRELLWDWISPYCTLASRGVCTDWLFLWINYKAFYETTKAEDLPPLRYT